MGASFDGTALQENARAETLLALVGANSGTTSLAAFVKVHSSVADPLPQLCCDRSRKEEEGPAVAEQQVALGGLAGSGDIFAVLSTLLLRQAVGPATDRWSGTAVYMNRYTAPRPPMHTSRHIAGENAAAGARARHLVLAYV